jgi:Formyl transferase
MTETVVLITSFSGPELARLKAAFAGVSDVRVISTARQLNELQFGPNVLLLSFGSGIIVPHEILGRLGRPAYNLHAASPEFPGRDPHHHAIYRRARTYGATLHVMTEKVDAGPIVAIETFPVPSDATPTSLLAAANEAGMRAIEKCAARLLDAQPIPALADVVWGTVKTTRSDLIGLSRLSPLIDEDEFERRFHAFDGGAHDNLVIELHHQTFRIDKRSSEATASAPVENDFTEQAFRELLGQLKAEGYRFAGYGDRAEGRHVIWRHDVDFSMHRAAALAQIEAQEGVTATYFVNPRSSFYNLLEPAIVELARRIAGLGHEIGLHFDAAAYAAEKWEPDFLEKCIERERHLLQFALEAPIRSLSWHNPDSSNLLDFDADEIAGMRSAYSRRLRSEYRYCSDSNGYWRFQPMSALIAEGHPRLHLLTHPEWWTKERLPPSERVDRAILGRARRVRREYDAGLERAGRRNVTS